MSGLGPFLTKELRETVRTWRIWVLPGFLLFSALSSPLLTYFTPMLLDRFGSAEQGLTIDMPDPTALQAYLEYLSNLNALTVFALVIAYGGIVSAEVKGGTAGLTLAKPLSRTAFIGAKWLSQSLVIIAATVVGTALSIGLTQLLFDGGPAGRAALAGALWIGYALMLLAVVVLLSVVLKAPAAASGGGIGVYVALLVLSQFEVTSRHTPAGLPAAGQAIVSGDPAHWQWPLATAVAVTAVCLLVAARRFARREI